MKRICLLAVLSMLSVTGMVCAKSLKVKEGVIYYEVRGKGPAIVLLHGGFGDSRMWNHQFDVFSKDFKVVRYDQLGFGKSSKPQAAYSPVAVLLQLMDSLKIQKANLIGNSMGGTLAIDFALLHPDRVLSLVIVGSGADGYSIPKEDKDRINAVFSTAAQKGPTAAEELWLAQPMVAVAISHPDSDELLRTMVKDNNSIFLMRFWPIEKMDPPGLERLNDIQVPTLVIFGDQDTRLVHAMAEATAAGIRGSRKVEIKNTDHLPQMEEPKEFNDLVTQFLKNPQSQKTQP
jgi:pimeloyl-ACP methyl ester carboxylesterase